MLAAMEEAIKLADQQSRNAASGMSDLFGDTVAASAPEIGYHGFSSVRRFTIKERLNGEKETLGLYLTGHPVDEYIDELAFFVPDRISHLKPAREPQLVAGLVLGLRVMKNKKGETMAFVVLDDRSGRLEVAIFADKYREYRDKIVKDALLVIEGVVSEDDYSGGLKMRAEAVRTLYEARLNYVRGLTLSVSREKLLVTGVDNLVRLLEPFRHGSCPVTVHYQGQGAEGKIRLGNEWTINPEDELLHKLRDSFGLGAVQLDYGR